MACNYALPQFRIRRCGFGFNTRYVWPVDIGPLQKSGVRIFRVYLSGIETFTPAMATAGNLETQLLRAIGLTVTLSERLSPTLPKCLALTDAFNRKAIIYSVDHEKRQAL